MIAPLPTFPRTATHAERLAGVAQLVRDLQSHPTRPILLGPWRSELGFEVLYWLPFLAYLKTKVKDFDARATIITRGGLAPLYSGVAATGYDLYVLRSVADVRRENMADVKRTGMLKQSAITEWDQAVMADAAVALGHSPVVDQVHPAWMYWALAPWWDDEAGMKYLGQLTAYERLPKPPRLPKMPDHYVAVKFYARQTCPYPDAVVAEFIRTAIAAVSAQTAVVLLNAGSAYDDHCDIPIAGPGLITLEPTTPPEQNLFLQASVLAHADAFVGTYGGMAQLALALGVPSCSIWKDWHSTSHAHFTLSTWLSKLSHVSFAAGSIADAVRWRDTIVVPAAQPALAPTGVQL